MIEPAVGNVNTMPEGLTVYSNKLSQYVRTPWFAGLPLLHPRRNNQRHGSMCLQARLLMLDTRVPAIAHRLLHIADALCEQVSSFARRIRVVVVFLLCPSSGADAPSVTDAMAEDYSSRDSESRRVGRDPWPPLRGQPVATLLVTPPLCVPHHAAMTSRTPEWLSS